MKVAVTGGTGHLGANLVRALLDRGRDVRVVTAEPVDKRVRSLDWLDVERVQADVRDSQGLERALHGADVVYHLAAKISIVDWDGDEVWAVNVGGTSNVVDACLKSDVRRLVHVSSYHAFSPGARGATHEDAPASVGDDETPYARSKAFGERVVMKGVTRGLDAVVVNPTGMVGPWDCVPSMFGRLLIDLFRGRVPAVVSGGVNCVDVRDVADTLISAERKGLTGQRYLVGGHWVSLAELGELCCTVTGAKPPRMVTPMWLARAVAPVAERFSRMTKRPPRVTEQSLIALGHHRLVLDGRAQEHLGHRARPIEETLEDTYEWFAGHGLIKAVERRERSSEEAG
jgi:dihydroflavonol-4-reductase